MFEDHSLKTILKKAGRLKPSELTAYADLAAKKNEKLGDYLIAEKHIGDEELYRTASTILKIPFIDLEKRLVRKDILFLIPEPLARNHEIIAFEATPKELFIATTNPDDLQIFDFISKKTNLALRLHLATPRALREILKQYRLTLEAEFEKIKSEQSVGAEETQSENLAKLAEDLPVVRIVDSLLDHAIFEGASDIHIEPTEQEVLVRYRVDGILRNAMVLPKITHSGIVARIKILSNLKLDEHRLPQDGRFKIATRNYAYSFRVSILPEMDGEKVVMRLLSETAAALTLLELGLLPHPLETVKKNLEKPHGIIFITGPTGSGKTTTLYSLITILNKPGVNIQTIEDPIEYRIRGVNQSQVTARIGFTFAQGLRSILRQDPNVIMVGEIRDEETADIALHAALTGHLVLSTLHTNDAATALPRLVQMNVPPFLIASTTNLIIAQRLVRKLCSGCRTPYKANQQNFKEFGKKFDLDRAIELAKKQKLYSAKNKLDITLYKAVGCKQCSLEGYKGRVGIYEVMEITPKIQALINAGATAEEIKTAAIAEGMITILEDGLIKILQGITTPEEVMRVTKE